MECQLTEDIQRPRAVHQRLPTPSGHPASLAPEMHMGNAAESMHRESALVSSTWIVPGGAPFTLKSSRSFYTPRSWADSPFEDPAASPFNTPNASRSHLFVAPPSARPTAASSRASDLTMTDSSGIPSLALKESSLPHPRGKVGERKEKKTKLGKMYQQASKSTKAISRLFFHSPPSGGAVKPSAPKPPLPLIIPPEDDLVSDPFASGKFVSSYGLSPVETNPPASLQRSKSFMEAVPTKTELLQPPLSSPPAVLDFPSLKNPGQVVERKHTRSREILFPPNAEPSSSISSPPSQRIRSISVSATRAAKSFPSDTPPPMPTMPPTAPTERPWAANDLRAQLLPQPFPVSQPEQLARLRTYSLSETKYRATVQLTKAVPQLKDDAKSSSNSDDLRPFPVFPPTGDNSAVAVQTQTQASDSDLALDTLDGRVASSSSGHYLKPSLDRPWRPTACLAKDMDPVVESPSCSMSESRLKPLPPVVASGISEGIRQREGSGLTLSEKPLPTPFQQDQSVAKPTLHPLLTQNLSSSAISSDCETLVNGSPRNQRNLLPRSPSLPNLRPGFADGQPVPKDKLIPLAEHVRSPSLPNFSDRSLPQVLPASIVDRLKSRDRGSPRPKSRMSSTSSISSSERSMIVAEKTVASGSDPNRPQSVRRDAGFRAQSHYASVRPLAIHEKKNGRSEISSTFRFGHTHIPLDPSLVPSFQGDVSKIESPPSTTALPLRRAGRGLRFPSVPDLRARANASTGSRGQPPTLTHTPPSQTRHVQSYSHSHSIPVPPTPPLPESYKIRSSPANVKSETDFSSSASSPPPLNDVNFCRPRLNLTRPMEMSYPPSKKDEKLLHECLDEELRDVGFVGVGGDGMGRVARTPSVMVSSSLGDGGVDRRRMLHRFRSLSVVKGQGRGRGGGDGVPPVPPMPASPLPPLPPVLPLNVRDRSARGGAVIGAAL